MSNPIIKAVISTKFLLTSRDKASGMIRSNADAYLRLADRFGAGEGMEQVTVPPMIGVDPEMRGWSFFQILEHNVIVNRSIAAMVEALALGKQPAGAALINPKSDVLPKGVSGSEQIGYFRQSVDDYLSMVSTLPSLRGTAETPHPVFGSFDAHKWHCMFGFHLGLHLKQAERVLAMVAGE
ncbi:MAG: DinB family protein [Verrucomicrobia bacterium]|jgi:hypothetical protein|nr:DinB family protein [Verrucomicrobiota bacterium]